MEYNAMSAQSREDLIASLTEDLTPVKRVTPRQGAALITFGAMLSGLACIAIFGFWAGMFQGQASPFFWIANGLLALTGAASTAALAAMGTPRVGTRGAAPFWSAAMLGIMPLTAIISYLTLEAGHVHTADLMQPTMSDLKCAICSLAASAFVGIAAVVYLRRSAPVSLERAGWLTGLASGSLGALAYGLTCPLDTITHLGMYHVLPVAAAAVIMRYAVPPLIRW